MLASTIGNADDDASSPRLAPALGVLDGKYALIRKLGSGASGVVFEAEHLAGGKRVAVKVLHPRPSRDETFREHFIGEAQAAANIGHANAVTLHDYGVTTDGRAYLVMELLEGETLEELMRSRGAMPPATACQLLVQVLAALGAAHRSGIVHGSLEPSGIIVTCPRPDTRVVKVLGFVTADRAAAKAPKAEVRLPGAAVYMSPEQAQGRAVDARTDVYTAGVILYEMLAGESPFSGTAAEMLGKVVAGKWRPLAQVNPAVPRPLVAAVSGALARDPAMRLQTAADFGRRLTPFLSRPPPHSIPESLTPAESSPGQVGTDASAAVHSDVPASRPPRDFPSLGLARVAGKPRGEPLADSLLQSPIIPRAPSAPKIHLFGGEREVEHWSSAPGPSSGARLTLGEPMPAQEGDPGAHDAVREAPSEEPVPMKPAASGHSEDGRNLAGEGNVEPGSLRRALWAAALGIGVGAIIAWLYRMG